MLNQTNNYFIDCPITTEPLPDILFEGLEPSAQERFLAIERAVYQGDISYIPHAEEMIKEYSCLPKLYNFLEGLYKMNGQQDKAEALAEDMYQRFPDYLFSKTAYAKLCMKQGRIAEFEKIFEGKCTLNDLYPDRDKFHLSEFLAFTDVLCLHACHQKNFDFVKQTTKILESVEFIPDDFLETLENYLYRFENVSLMDRILSRIQWPGRKKYGFEF